MPSPGRQISGMDGTSVKPTTGLKWDWVWHPVDLPKGYRALPRGKPGKLGWKFSGMLAPGSEKSPGNRYSVTSTPKAQPVPKQARRRDGIPAPHRCPAARQHPASDCRFSLACPRVPLLRVTKGQPRSPSSAGQITPAQGHDRCPIFHAGHADSSSSPAAPRSVPSVSSGRSGAGVRHG